MKYFTAITLLAVSLLALPAQAYVLPTDYILRLMLDVQAEHKIKDASLKLSTEMLGNPEKSSERLYIKSPERLRLLSENDEAALYIEREGVRAEGTDGALTKLKTLPTNLLASLRFPKGKKTEAKSGTRAPRSDFWAPGTPQGANSRLPGKGGYAGLSSVKQG